MLTANTKVYVINKKDGSRSELTLSGWFNAITAGSRWDDHEVTLDARHSVHLEKKYAAIRRMVEVMTNMTPGQASAAVDFVIAQKDLTPIAEEYA
jgi:hypothetical protein